MSFVSLPPRGNIRFAAIRVRGEPHPVTETGNSPCLIVVSPQVTPYPPPSSPHLFFYVTTILYSEQWSVNNEMSDNNMPRLNSRGLLCLVCLTESKREARVVCPSWSYRSCRRTHWPTHKLGLHHGYKEACGQGALSTTQWSHHRWRHRSYGVPSRRDTRKCCHHVIV